MSPLCSLSLQLRNPAYGRLADMGCASTIGNNWRAMRHRLRRRLDRQRLASMKAPRASKVTKAGGSKGSSRGHANGGAQDTVLRPRVLHALLAGSSGSSGGPGHSATAYANSAAGSGGSDPSEKKREYDALVAGTSESKAGYGGRGHAGGGAVEPIVKRTRTREPAEHKSGGSK